MESFLAGTGFSPIERYWWDSDNMVRDKEEKNTWWKKAKNLPHRKVRNNYLESGNKPYWICWAFE